MNATHTEAELAANIVLRETHAFWLGRLHVPRQAGGDASHAVHQPPKSPSVPTP